MENTNAVYLLILDQSQNDSESYISLLRNAGIPVRALRIESETELLDSLYNQSWDLMISRIGASELQIEVALSHMREQDRDIPTIVVSSEPSEDQTVQLLKAGAKDVVFSEHSAHLIEVVKRELEAQSQRKQLRAFESQTRESEKRSKLLLDNAKDPVAYITEGMHVYANDAYLSYLGYEDIDDLICVPVLDTLSGSSIDLFKELSRKFMDSGSDSLDASDQMTHIRSDGQEISANIVFSKATYEGETCLQILVKAESSQDLPSQVKTLAETDIVTGLFNRNYLIDAVSEAKQESLASGAAAIVFYIEINDFSKLKSQVGIADIDILLRDLAQLVNENSLDSMLVTRISDESFGLLAKGYQEDECLDYANKLCKLVEEHVFEVGGLSTQITIRVGLTTVRENAPDAPEILGRAHAAIASESADGSVVKLYSPKFDNKLNDEDTAVELINEALEKNKFKLLFQPIIGLRGDSEEHYEAFVRMLDRDDKEVSPYDFLPPSGPRAMASKIDRWVVEQTIGHLKAHRSKGHNTKLFINLTAETVQDETFAQWLSKCLQAARLPGNSLIFQVSESNAITYLKQAKDFCKSLKQLHCEVSINQFGRALNPYNLLKHIEAGYIKLEGSFTKELSDNEKAKEEAKEMIKTLQSMGKLSIVPLVESASVLSYLWQAGANYIQGYYLQAPSSEMDYNFSEES